MRQLLVGFFLVASLGVANAQSPPPPPPPPMTPTPAPNVTAASDAPRTRFGGRLGVNFGKLPGDLEDIGADMGFRTAFSVGAFVLVPLAPNLFVDLGAGYAQKGATLDGENKVTIKTDYISVPLLAVYAIPVSPTMRIRVLGGGHASFLLAADLEAEGMSESLKDNTKSIDFGIIVGAGIEANVGRGNLIFDLRFELGLASIDDSEENAGEIKQQVISANAGYAF